MSELRDVVITNITDVITVFSQKGQTEQMIRRKNYGLSFCTEGQITYVQNGKEYVSDKNCAIILPKGQSYEILREKTGFFPLINFNCINFWTDTFKVIPLKNTAEILKDFENLKSSFLFKENKAKVMSIFYGIIHKLACINSPETHIISPATEYLENNLRMSDITNKFLAEICNISEVYFRKLFLKAYGVTPKQYIIDARIKRAKQLLSDGNLKISSVAEDCGFSNQYHFCRIFKEKTGLTPTGYMREYKVKEF